MVKIRPARYEDSEFVARGFMTAMWIPDEQITAMMPMLRTVAEMEGSLYHWTKAMIAECDGERAGVLISYDGATYSEAAKKTFTYVRDNGGEDFTQMTEEAEPGEWYIDTLAVMPEYRRQGIATQLLAAGIEKGLSTNGIKKVTLYVDPDHPWVVDLYRKVGFEPDGEAFIFGQMYQKMAVIGAGQPIYG